MIECLVLDEVIDLIVQEVFMDFVKGLVFTQRSHNVEKNQ